MTESVFSMDGDRAPLASLLEVSRRHQSFFMVDEAHATGVFGPQGRGCVEADGLAGEVDLVMGTFSKALGGFGGYLAASRTIVDFLVNSARSFIYSTALPAPVIAANLAALRLCLSGEAHGEGTSFAARRHSADALRAKGWVVGGDSQIVPVVVGESGRAVSLSGYLAERGFLVLPVRPPTVPEGSARLRFSLTAAHTDSQVARRPGGPRCPLRSSPSPAGPSPRWSCFPGGRRTAACSTDCSPARRRCGLAGRCVPKGFRTVSQRSSTARPAAP